MVKQCEFTNRDGETFGGIYCRFDNGDEYIINGADGEIVDLKDLSYFRIWKYWIDFSNEIRESNENAV